MDVFEMEVVGNPEWPLFFFFLFLLFLFAIFPYQPPKADKNMHIRFLWISQQQKP